MKTTFFLKTIAIIACIGLVSCEKTKQENAEAIRQTADDNAYISGEFFALFDLSDNVSRDDEVNNLIAGNVTKDSKLKKASPYLPDCATATFSSETKTLIIDYGDTNCLCKDGLYRRGLIQLNYNGQYLDSGSFVQVSLNNYFVQDIKFNGTKTIRNLGNDNGNYRFAYEVRNASAETENGTITWETDAEIEKIAGDNTIFNPFDDIYLTTGSSAGVNRNGVSYTANVTTPLKKRIELNAACLKHYVSGVIRLDDENGNFLEFDYDPIGGEPCDRIARVNINDDFMEDITLR